MPLERYAGLTAERGACGRGLRSECFALVLRLYRSPLVLSPQGARWLCECWGRRPQRGWSRRCKRRCAGPLECAAEPHLGGQGGAPVPHRIHIACGMRACSRPHLAPQDASDGAVPHGWRAAGTRSSRRRRRTTGRRRSQQQSSARPPPSAGNTRTNSPWSSGRSKRSLATSAFLGSWRPQARTRV